MHVDLPLNQFKPVQQSSEQAAAAADNLLCMKSGDTQWSTVSYLKKVNKDYCINEKKIL